MTKGLKKILQEMVDFWTDEGIVRMPPTVIECGDTQKLMYLRLQRRNKLWKDK